MATKATKVQTLLDRFTCSLLSLIVGEAPMATKATRKRGADGNESNEQ